MSRRARILVGVGAVLGALSLALAGPLSAPAGAVPVMAASYSSGDCTAGHGVTVVVDFESLGGGVVVRCDSGATSSTTGWKALQDTGFDPVGTVQYPGSFVCSLDNKPKPPCVTTPPTTAYWSYWHAADGGSWSYSSEGAGTRHVTVGGLEGWAFSTSSGTSVAPRSGTTLPKASSPSPSHSSGGSGGSASGSGSSGGSSSTHHPSKPSPSSTSNAHHSPSATSTAASSPTATPAAGATSSAPAASSTTANAVAAGESSGPSHPSGGGGSALPFAGGVAAIAVIAGFAFFIARQRRSSGF